MATRNTPYSHFAAFEKAILLLTHPLSLAAVGLMLTNDLLLRRLWPSWLTGKFSDAAWLVFVPFLAAALLSGLFPFRRKTGSLKDQSEDWIFGLAFAFTGLGFAAIKTLPGVNLLATRIFAFLLNTTPALSFDPSDLLALPALLIPLSMWLRQRSAASDGTAPAPAAPARTARALLALPLIVIVLLADAPAPDPGFTCFQITDGRIYASAGYNSYVSEDGGLTWQYNQPGGSVDCAPIEAAPEGWTEVGGALDDRRYRFRAGEEIQVSTDGGASWQPGRRLNVASEPERFYVFKSRDGNPIYTPGPLDAIADPASGNMLFAMGQEGIIVHQADGEWVNSGGESYQNLENFPDISAFIVLLGGNILLAFTLALLVFATGAMRHTFHPIRLAALLIAWLGWLIVNLIFPPATAVSYATFISVAGMLLTGLFILPLAVEQAVRLFRRAPRKVNLLITLALASGLVFFLPYVLWLIGILPRFDLANLAGIVVAAAFTAASLLKK